MKNTINMAALPPFNGETLWGNLDRKLHIVEQDVASLYLKELDLSQIVFTNTLVQAESTIHGHDRRRRLEDAGGIRLDARLLVCLWQNKEGIPECFRHAEVEPKQRWTTTSFDGTILSDTNGLLSVPVLHWDRERKVWDSSLKRLDYIWWDKTCQAAVLQQARRHGQDCAIADILNKEPVGA